MLHPTHVFPRDPHMFAKYHRQLKSRGICSTPHPSCIRESVRRFLLTLGSIISPNKRDSRETMCTLHMRDMDSVDLRSYPLPRTIPFSGPDSTNVSRHLLILIEWRTPAESNTKRQRSTLRGARKVTRWPTLRRKFKPSSCTAHRTSASNFDQDHPQQTTKSRYRSKPPASAAPIFITTTMAATAPSCYNLPSC